MWRPKRCKGQRGRENPGSKETVSMEMVLSLPGLSAAGGASFTFLRTVFAKYGVSNRDLRRALLPEMEIVKERWVTENAAGMD